MYMRWIYALAKGILLVIWWRIGTKAKSIENRNELKNLKEYAQKTNKPILNIGCGNTDCDGTNVDIIPMNVKNFQVIDANRPLPFKDKEFSGVFASHVLEHLSSPDFSLKEMRRVGEKVYIGRPRWWQLGTWLTIDHKWLIFKRKNEDFRFIKYHALYAYILVALYLLL